MNVLLWILQVLLAVYFLFTGVVHFVLPPGLPDQMGWMYELSPTLHYISGAAEILGGLGLILPGITRIKTWLTPLAAAGLMVVMILAAFWHLPRGESLNIGMNLVMVLLTGFVAYARWKVKPL
ncbi:MAG: DoxX family protein [Anaerolineales bacterium]|nr:DoxX family protein [Anaerolineales bacterium]